MGVSAWFDLHSRVLALDRVAWVNGAGRPTCPPRASGWLGGPCGTADPARPGRGEVRMVRAGPPTRATRPRGGRMVRAGPPSRATPDLGLGRMVHLGRTTRRAL